MSEDAYRARLADLRRNFDESLATLDRLQVEGVQFSAQRIDRDGAVDPEGDRIAITATTTEASDKVGTALVDLTRNHLQAHVAYAAGEATYPLFARD